MLSPSAYIIYMKVKKCNMANHSGMSCHLSKFKAKKGIVLAFEEGCHMQFLAVVLQVFLTRSDMKDAVTKGSLDC